MQSKQDGIDGLRIYIESLRERPHGPTSLQRRADALESVLDELEQLRTQNGRMQFALESISGCFEVDYAIRRANEVLAEIGVPGYEAC